MVTGSSRGIGRAVAHALAAEGAGGVVNGRDRDAAETVADEIVLRGGRAIAVAGSAAADGVAEALVDAAECAFGDVDVLINCAGVAEPAGSSILTVTDEQWRELIDAHLTATFRTCRAVAPLMAERGRGAIVNTGSFAFLGDYGGTGYPAGKGAVNSLTLAIAAELAESGVRANVVCPGAKTRLSEGRNTNSTSTNCTDGECSTTQRGTAHCIPRPPTTSPSCTSSSSAISPPVSPGESSPDQVASSADSTDRLRHCWPTATTRPSRPGHSTNWRSWWVRYHLACEGARYTNNVYNYV
ncbi:Short-chain dehydrogenase/reductase SDR [Rhodococcus wratislaviensis]|uniref:Short-chain dehydrogenase/reductase SDR n=1 Tax=Rhodococcus wratislaviensis TaxID=44752 RepID=A0A402C156_RHOWR|nr:Short-chain dehydrogenase/reductase SDR [Rhodococcus wratislaviensis]